MAAARLSTAMAELGGCSGAPLDMATVGLGSVAGLGGSTIGFVCGRPSVLLGR